MCMVVAAVRWLVNEHEKEDMTNVIGKLFTATAKKIM